MSPQVYRVISNKMKCFYAPIKWLNGRSSVLHSGGPNFLNIDGYDSNIIAAVTSFGINGNCAGTGGVYRLDKQDDLDWVNSFM